MLLALLVGILAYSAYTQKQIYQESTANLLSTYGQSAKTFTMFAQRNWNILNDWDSYLGTLAELGEQEGQWQEYIAQKATWQYTDFYLFNEQCEFWTTAGRQGTAEYMKATFEKLYTENKPVISSYISSQGIRKILFAIPMEQPLQLDGTTYTALVVSYDNAVLEKLLGSMVYEGQSDCYIVRSNGDVVLSTETKTEITEQMTNLFDYLQQNASVDQPYFDTMVQTLPQGGEGCVLYTLNRQKYYLIYQPLGLMDWSIIGIVPTGVVDAGMRRVQVATILVIALLGLLIMAGVIKIQRDAERNRRRELERRREKERYDVCGHGTRCGAFCSVRSGPRPLPVSRAARRAAVPTGGLLPADAGANIAQVCSSDRQRKRQDPPDAGPGKPAQAHQNGQRLPQAGICRPR